MGDCMKYVVINYVGKCQSPPGEDRKEVWFYRCFKKFFELLKKLRFFKQFELYRQCSQLQIERSDRQVAGISIIYLTICAYPRELEKLPEKRIQEKVLCALTLVPEKMIGQQDADMRLSLLYVHPALISYVPEVLQKSDEEDEVYINLMQAYLMQACTTSDLDRRHAKLLFLDDGKGPVDMYMKALSKDWNYVAVYSKRHEQWEDCYRQLYEEEGLMVECCSAKAQCKGDVVIDLSESPKKLQHMYPAGSLVLNRWGILGSSLKRV